MENGGRSLGSPRANKTARGLCPHTATDPDASSIVSVSHFALCLLAALSPTVSLAWFALSLHPCPYKSDAHLGLWWSVVRITPETEFIPALWEILHASGTQTGRTSQPMQPRPMLRQRPYVRSPQTFGQSGPVAQLKTIRLGDPQRKNKNKF